MDISQTALPGVRLVSLDRSDDPRGSFVKTYSRDRFESDGIALDLREEFYSLSKKDVVRGMHFQLPPHDHVKLVYCASGAVLDVLLDLRRGSGQGRSIGILLEASKPMLLFIPRGVAHGFKSLADDSLMVYKTSAEYAPSHDAGIRWNSFGFDWGVANPVISARDAALPVMADFQSPF
jgi:dTDP-4-dehydrorhamnose 3,5-epimerase